MYAEIYNVIEMSNLSHNHMCALFYMKETLCNNNSCMLLWPTTDHDSFPVKYWKTVNISS